MIQDLPPRTRNFDQREIAVTVALALGTIPGIALANHAAPLGSLSRIAGAWEPAEPGQTSYRIEGNRIVLAKRGADLPAEFRDGMAMVTGLRYEKTVQAGPRAVAFHTYRGTCHVITGTGADAKPWSVPDCEIRVLDRLNGGGEFDISHSPARGLRKAGAAPPRGAASDATAPAPPPAFDPVNPVPAPSALTDAAGNFVGFGAAASPSAPLVKLTVPAQSIVREYDYPPRASATEQQGTAQIELAVGPSGVPTGCRIQISSGHSILDQASCSVWMRRARFAPATDAKGQAIPGRYAVRVAWILAD